MLQRDQEFFTDFLYSERHLVTCYNQAAMDASNGPVKAELLNLLSECHQIYTSLYDEMEKRQWVQQSEAADAEKVEILKQKSAKILATF